MKTIKFTSILQLAKEIDNFVQPYGKFCRTRYLYIIEQYFCIYRESFWNDETLIYQFNLLKKMFYLSSFLKMIYKSDFQLLFLFKCFQTFYYMRKYVSLFKDRTKLLHIRISKMYIEDFPKPKRLCLNFETICYQTRNDML